MQKGFRWLFPTFFLLPKIGQMLIEKSASKKNKKVNSLRNSCTTLSFLFHFFEQLSEGFQQKLIFSSLGTQPEFVEQELNFPCLYFVNVGGRPDKQTKKFFHGWFFKWLPLLGVTFFLFLRSFYFFSNIFP
jgi:hypothetical protein